MIQKLSAMQETELRSQGREDPLEEGTAAHSRSLAWRIPRTEGPGGLRSLGSNWTRLNEFHSLLNFLLGSLLPSLDFKPLVIFTLTLRLFD